MEAFVNRRKVKINAEIGRWSSLGGLLVLIVGMVFSIRNPSLVWVSMGSLLFGFLASVVGAYYANHWTRTPRPDQVLEQALKGISNKYHLYSYLLPVSHVMLGPAGLFVFRTFTHEGLITYDGKKWRQKRSVVRMLGFTGQEPLTDPVQDALHDARRLERWLAQRLTGRDVPRILPFVVFVSEGVELDIAETPIPVLHHKQLKGRIRQLDKEYGDLLTTDELYAIEQAMVGEKIDEL